MFLLVFIKYLPINYQYLSFRYFFGGKKLRIPFTMLGAAYYNLRDKLGF